MKYKIIALIGKAGSGKDTILQKVLSNNSSLHKIISFTTRPPREGEVDGINYHFVNTEKFTKMLLENKMLEVSEFNNWFYGTGYDSLLANHINIGVFNPDGIDAMLGRKDIDLYVFYIEATDKNRLIRQLNRESEPDIEEIFRRYKTDFVDFADLDFHYNVLENNKETDLIYCTKVVLAAAKNLQDKTY